MNYIHITKHFKEEIGDDSRKSLIYTKLETLKNVQQLETLNSVDNLSKGIYVVKFSKTNLCRIITQLKEIELDGDVVSVLFVREFITKKSFNYYWGSVLHPQLKSGEWLNKHVLPNSEIAEFKKKYLEIKNHKEVLKKLPPRLSNWLESFKITLKFDVFEREDWVNFANNKSQDEGLNERDIDKYKRTLKEILEPNKNNTLEKTKLNNNTYAIINKYDEVGLIISDFENVDQSRIILLHNGAHITRQSNHWKKAIENAKEAENDILPNLEEISKDAFRAYPKWVLNQDKDDYWGAIQRHDDTFNLALLPEQVNFLKDFKFPSYINGQAGSGKSTMLHYLFANVFAFKSSEELEGNILFLTENDNLLEHSIRSVTGLLANNPEFDFGFTVEDKMEVRNFFSSFKNFLLEILPSEERLKFPEEKYLDFSCFKDKYNNQYTKNKNKYSAEEAWFVISTYVYGYFENIKIDTIEKYVDQTTGVPSKFRIIDETRFQEIIETALPFYDNLINDGWWSKTTLVRAIRGFFPDNLPNQYSVVFCDEAQDFSRIELRLILKSCEYTNFDLSDSEQIPVVFAGDALQSVSPIGFTVKRLQQVYYETFQEANFNYEKNKSTYTPNYNYRSVEPIVRLANIVQNYRKESLEEGSTLKQKAKRSGKTNLQPILHYKEWLLKINNKNTFDEKFKFKSFIVPVDLNEEDNYVQNDALLNEKFPDIKSSIDAKGAEYSQVVVYGFGEQHVKNFGVLSWNSDSGTNEFKKKFFFNKLYVAITRAQNELVIIDSEEAYELFWKPLFDIPDSVSDRWEVYNDINDVLLVNPETGLDLILKSVPEDAYNNAQLDMEQGIKDENIARLIVASNVFLVLGKHKEANKCLGHKELIKRNWKSAGEYFIKASELETASNSFFQGKKWESLLDVSSAYGGIKQEVRVLIAKMMKEGDWSTKELKKIYEYRDSTHPIIHDVIWYDEFSERVSIYSKKIKSSEGKRDLVIILHNLVRDNDLGLLESIASLYFDTKQFSNAIKVWDLVYFNESLPSYSKKYLQAQVENAKDEGNLENEILWSGRLLNQVESLEDGMKTKLAKFLLNSFKTELELYKKSKLKFELALNLYRALVHLHEIPLLSEVGRIVESNYTDLASLIDEYAKLIKVCENEEIGIFLKERWIKLKIDHLKLRFNSPNVRLEKANNDFLKIDFPLSESNKAWSQDEINEISELPEKMSSIPSNHFKNIIIENFRKFEHLEINNLGQFNLILGDNNSGKTSVLEALLFSNNPDVFLLNILFANRQRNNNAKKEGVTSFFTNIIYNNSVDRKIHYTIKDGRRFWKYSIGIPDDSDLNKTEVSNELFLEIESSSKEKQISQSVQNVIKRLDDPEYLKKVPFIAFGKGYFEKMASIYQDEIGKVRKQRLEFIAQLKIFIPNIVGIFADTDKELIEIEEVNGEDDIRKPLHNYGEGANKLFRILIQLHAAKNGRLNIDEIDAGIHYSKFKLFWKIILRMANHYNVQLFATTHNEECIRYFWEVLNEEDLEQYRAKSRIITLERHVQTKDVIPIVREFENMKYSYEHHLEMRGKA